MLNIKQICLDDVAKKSNVEYMLFVFESRASTATVSSTPSSPPYSSAAARSLLDLQPGAWGMRYAHRHL